MDNLLKLIKNMRSRWFIISAIILILGVAVILFKSNKLSGYIPNRAIVIIQMEDTNIDKNKFAQSVQKIDASAVINYIDSDAKVDVVTSTKEKADEIFNQIKTDFSLKADKPYASGDILYKAINFNLGTVLSIVGVCFVFSFIVFWVLLGYRYAFSNIVAYILSIISILATFLILNLQLNMTFVAVIILSLVLIFYFDMTNCIIIKDQLKKVKKAVLNDVMDYMYTNTIKNNAIVCITILGSLLILAIVISFLRRYAFATFIAILFSLYYSYFLTSPLWQKIKVGEKLKEGSKLKEASKVKEGSTPKEVSKVKEGSTPKEGQKLKEVSKPKVSPKIKKGSKLKESPKIKEEEKSTK